MENQITSVNAIRMWNVFKKIWFLVLIIVSLCASLGYGYTALYAKPVYRAQVEMFVGQLKESAATENQTTYQTQSEVVFSRLLVNDCVYLANSMTVIDQTNKTLEKNGLGKISAMNVTAEAIEDTRYFKLFITTGSSQLSNGAATALAESLKDQTTNLLKIDNVQKISQTSANVPIKQNPMQTALTGAAVGLLISAGIIALIAFSDRTFKRAEEFSSLFPGLTILGSIPEFDIHSERNAAKKGKKNEASAAKKRPGTSSPPDLSRMKNPADFSFDMNLDSGKKDGGQKK